MKIELKTKRYFPCPNRCEGAEFFVEHLLIEHAASSSGAARSSAGPWFCDTCGQGWLITVHSDGTLDVVGTKNETAKKYIQYVILEIPPQTSSIYLKVKGMRFRKEVEPEQDRYFYEQHTCPSNCFRSTEEVSIDGNNDPHGLLKVVAVYDAEGEGGELGAKHELVTKERPALPERTTP